MAPDPRWLEILKTSGWQLGLLALALFAFWLMLWHGLLPPIGSPWVVYGLPLAILITGGLALASIFEFATTKAREAWRRRQRRKEAEAAVLREQEDLRGYIPFMTETEKRVLGYLLAHQQKMFTTQVDAGEAATLLSRGIVRLAVQSGQQVSVLAVPFYVPDHLWDVLEDRRADFPDRFRDGESEPWHSDW